MAIKKTKSAQAASAETTEVVSAKQEVQPTWSPDQVELIKNTVAKGATDDELKLFLYTAGRTGLDPLTKQIHFVKRAGQMTIQTGIDGYRAIAERTGQLAGIEDAKYEEGKGMPVKASVTVYRMVKGIRADFTASARWNEYVPKGGQSFMWQKMPYLMLGKVAEALALRKAFPLNLSGIYTSDEMAQADNKSNPDTPPQEALVLPQPKPTKREYTEKEILKMSIQENLNILGVGKNIEAIKAFIKDNVQLELIPDNYKEIDIRLAAIVSDKNEVKDQLIIE